MDRYGFQLTGIRVGGPGREPAVIRFEAGLNVVTGASDTGKSYILELLNFMLGGAVPPKAIPEADGYERAALGIKARDGREFVLRRALREAGPVELVASPLDTHSDAPVVTVLAATQKGHPSVSSFLLELCGLEGKRIRTNARGTTENLSFRHLKRFLLVDETRIMEARSPTKPSAQRTDQTPDASVLRLLLTGVDDSDVVEEPKPEVLKAAWRAQMDLLGRMLEDAEQELAGIAPAPPEPGEFESTQRDLVRVRELYDAISRSIAESAARASLLVAEIGQRENELASTRQVESQFGVLLAQYESDQERLGFILETEFLLAQLGPSHCPMCGQSLDADSTLEDHAEYSFVQQAIEAELVRIAARRTELASLLTSVSAEADRQALELRALERQLSATLSDTDDEMERRLENYGDALATSARRLSELSTYESLRSHMDHLADRRSALGPEPTLSRNAPQAMSVREARAREVLADTLSSRLREWRFGERPAVSIDDQRTLLIDHQTAESRGKGLRAVIHAAFSITLMEVAADTGHPGFVVLDSPVTSYREKASYEVSEDIQAAFFGSVAKTPDFFQVIVLENKEPSSHRGMRYTHFTGTSQAGKRAGFYPTPGPGGLTIGSS
jgi:hypothetical protein